jgi:hypothetical protein
LDLAQVDAIVLINGQEAGTYRERTIYGADRIEDTIEQEIVINRLGSRVEISTKDVSIQDTNGRLIGGHFESSSSRSTVITDLVVQGEALALTIQSGGRSYSQTVPYRGELLGPEGMRRLITNSGVQPAHYETYLSMLGGVANISLKSLPRETLTVDGTRIEARKLEVTTIGLPTAYMLWVDVTGHTLQMMLDSPFGPIEIRRSANTPQGLPAGADLPAESYENTLALSNIRLPHPRLLNAVTVEMTKKDGEGGDWPNLASETQRVLTETPDRIVLEVSQMRMRANPDVRLEPQDIYTQPNSLLQSDDPEVQQIAKRVAGGEPDSWKVALALQRWTSQNMHFDTGIAIAPASEVARDRHGTCIGYAILLAALARADHIPSRLKMGYVYEGKTWGGHAWVEVFIRGQWLPIDAAEYSPGIADAARIGVITATGQSGTIEGVGDLAKLYSKVDIRTVSYRGSGALIRVGRSAEDHSVQGHIYRNPWLGLRVKKPAGSSFADLDAHWPNATVVTIKASGATASILYAHADPNSSALDLAANLAAPFEFSDPPHKILWAGVPVVRAHAGDKYEILSVQGDALWAIVASGTNSRALFAQILRATSIADLHGPRS